MNIFKYISSNIVKWWQIHITPILHINNNKRGRGRFEGGDGNLENQYASMYVEKPVNNPAVQTQENGAQQGEAPAEGEVSKSLKAATGSLKQSLRADKEQHINSDILNNTVPEGTSTDAMEVLNRINREKDEARKRAVEKQWKQREEEERIAAIMNSNKVNLEAMIEEGKHKAEEQKQEQNTDIGDSENLNADAKEENTSGEITFESAAASGATEEQLRRAQEIMDRLNREAAEDEAKKQAEIEAAKQKAKEAGL